MERISDELAAMLMDPNISDEDKCKAIFKGEVFECVGCGEKIYWQGACDACIDKFDHKGEPRTKREAVEATGVMRSMSDASWETWVTPKRLATKTATMSIHEINARLTRLQSWKGDPRLVVISGPPGTGKTHLAVATIRRRIEWKTHHGVLFIQGDRLVDALTDTSELYNEAFIARLLVIDDFGRKMTAEYRSDIICSFICRRIDFGRPTILTTNYTGADIQGIDERLFSRMHEGLVVNTRGLKDWRGGA